MRLKPFLTLLLLTVYGCLFVLANRHYPPTSEPGLQCPTSLSIDDSNCGSRLNQFYYSGNWVHCNQSCTPGDYKCTESSTCDPHAYVKLVFIGNRIRLYGAVGPWGGEATVKLDYTQANVNFCSDQCEGNVLIWDSGLLPSGTHTLYVYNHYCQDKRIAIDRVEIIHYPNLLQNPGFELICPDSSYCYDHQHSEYDNPPRWTADAERTPVVLELDNHVAHTGNYSYLISSECPNYAVIFQNVHVRRQTNCLISAWIRTYNVCHARHGSDDGGANVAPLNNYPSLSCVHSPGLFGTNDWTQRYVTFNTCELDYITVAGRLGTPNGFTTGTAWFDDFEFICEDF